MANSTNTKSNSNTTKKKLLYISHPSKGLKENTLDVEKIISELYKSDMIYNNFCILSPIHNFGFMYSTTEYWRGLSYCTDLLRYSHIMFLIGDWEESRGCREEVKICTEENIPYIYFPTSADLINSLNTNLKERLEEVLVEHLQN